MTDQAYLQQRERLLEDCFQSDHIYTDKVNRRTFNLVSANLLNFMPSIPVADHDSLFRQIEFHQQLALLDSQHEDPLQRVSYEGPLAEIIQLIKTRPAIVCSHHMGSFRLINYVLGLNGIKYSLVIGQNELKATGTVYQSLINHYQADIELISAHEANAGIRMVKALRNGRSLLVYVDGNTGTGDDSIRNENLLKTPFLNEAIYARQGVATLAYITNVPLIQVICYRETLDDIRLRFAHPIYPDKTLGKKNFSTCAIRQLYDSFALLVGQHPEQWECWKYLHSIINPQEFKPYTADRLEQASEPSQGLQFNSGLFGLLDINESYFLFNKKTYCSFPITTTIYNFLLASLRSETNVDSINDVMVTALYQHNVLTKIPDPYKRELAVA